MDRADAGAMGPIQTSKHMTHGGSILTIKWTKGKVKPSNKEEAVLGQILRTPLCSVRKIRFRKGGGGIIITPRFYLKSRPSVFNV